MYDSSRGLGYSGSYAAPGTSSSGSAEHRAEAEEIGAAAAAVSKDTGAGEDATTGAVPVVAMDLCPCPPAALFRDGDAYEEEDNDEGGDGTRLALVRRDGKALAAPGAGGQRNGANASGLAGGSGFSELFTADDLASDVGGLDRQLEDIVRRVLSTRSLPAEVRGVEDARGVRVLHVFCPRIVHSCEAQQTVVYNVSPSDLDNMLPANFRRQTHEPIPESFFSVGDGEFNFPPLTICCLRCISLNVTKQPSCHHQTPMNPTESRETSPARKKCLDVFVFPGMLFATMT